MKWFNRLYISIKIILYSFLSLLFVAFLILNSTTVIKIALDKGIPLAELPISYIDVYGGLIDGIGLNEVNYDDKVKLSFYAEVNYLKLLDESLEIERLEIKDFWIDKAYLDELSQAKSSDKNVSEEKNPTTIPYLKNIKINTLILRTKTLEYQSYILEMLNIEADNIIYDLNQSVKGDISISLKSNIADLEINSKLDLPNVVADIKTVADIDFLSQFTEDQNITIYKVPTIYQKLSGDFSKLNLQTVIENADISYTNAYRVKTDEITVNTLYNLETNQTSSHVLGRIDSNMAIIDLDTSFALNINDINNTLAFTFLSMIVPKEDYVLDLITDKNLSIYSMPSLLLDVKGNLESIDSDLHINNLVTKYADYELNKESIHVISKFDLQTKNLIADVNLSLNSNVADVNTSLSVALNSDDINRTLMFKQETQVNLLNSYLHNLDEKLVIKKPLIIDIVSDGDIHAITTNIELNTKVVYDNIDIETQLPTSNIFFNLDKNSVKGDIALNLFSSMADLSNNINFSVDLDDINNTLYYKTTTVANNLNIDEVELNHLAPFKINVDGTLKSMSSTIDSKKIHFKLDSEKFEYFEFNINTDKIHLSKILPKERELKGRFITIKADGFHSLNGETDGYFHITSNKDFILNISAKQKDELLKIVLKNSAIEADIKGVVTPMNLEADFTINSLALLQKELYKLYPFDMQDIDGMLKGHAKLSDKHSTITFDSPKISYDEISFNEFKTDIDYSTKRLLIKQFRFNIDGFKEKSFNREIKLTKGIVNLAEIIDFDIEIDKLLTLKGSKKGENLEAKIETKELPLGYPEYGKVILNSDILVRKEDLKTYITGDINLKDLLISYKSDFLEVEQDPDIKIVTKEDKKKTKETDSDTFKDNIFIDLNINTVDSGQYKVIKNEINFDIGLKVFKPLYKPLTIQGRIEEIEGVYDFQGKVIELYESAVAFRGLKEINPLLDIKAKHILPEATIFIFVTGDKNRPKINFSSDPLMSKKDIFSYLIFGVSSQDIGKSSGGSSNAAALFLSNAMTEDIAGELGLEKMELSETETGEISVEVGKRVSKDVLISIKTSGETTSVILEYDVNKNISLETETAEDSTALDLYYRKRY